MTSADRAPILLDSTRLIWRRWAGRRPTGIDRVCLAYAEHFADRAQAVVQHKYCRRILDRQESRRLFGLLADGGKGFRRKFALGAVLGGARRSADRGHGRIYLNIGHTGLDDPGYRSWLGQNDVRPVHFIHDLIPITHPHFCRSGEADRHRARIATALSGTAIIANSRATLDTVSSFARSEGLDQPPALAAWLGIDLDGTGVEASNRLAAGPPTFVMLGTIEGRKNHLMILRIWQDLAGSLGTNTPRLTIIGQRGWECAEALALLDGESLPRGVVTEIGGCDDRALQAHLRSARALLFPSLAEGYGLPLVEALASGTPVIASDLPVFREIGQGIPDLVDPLDPAAWRAMILAYGREGSPERSAQCRRLAKFAAPTWKSHFERVETFLAAL